MTFAFRRSPRNRDLFTSTVSRALEHSLRLGPHGLPLIGTGDWNDGLNRLGGAGQGESVWLAWFLIVCLRQFGQIAAGRGDQARSNRYQAMATQLSAAVEEHGWDGSWYLRAFFDDGTPLGSARSDECRIDSIAQSWAVISGSADPKRALAAMESVYQHLVRYDDRLILLLAPPSAAARWTLATSKATCRESGRMVPSTLMRPRGSFWPRRCSGRGSAASSFSSF